jgi:cytochrome c oxidase cbb3-type subunit III
MMLPRFSRTGERPGAKTFLGTSIPFSKILDALLLSVLAALLGASQPAGAQEQEKNPYAADSKAARLGEFQFRVNCAYCHGLGAKGGGRGPDLTRSRKKHARTDAELFHTINDGIPGTAMPPNGATQQGVGMTPEELWQVVTYIRSVEVKNVAPTGNANHGQELFYGSAACGTCHMVNGKGGRLGPDLSVAGSSRATEYLVESVRAPNKRLAQGISEAMKEFPQEYETAKIVARDGTKLTGVVMNEDSFTVQVMDMREQIHSFDKDKLQTFEKTRESLMPAYDEKMLPEKDLQDILAFLVGVSSSPGGGQ